MLKALSNFKSSRADVKRSTLDFARASIGLQPNLDHRLARKIIQISDEMRSLTDDQLLRSARSQRAKANFDSDLNSIMPTAFALVREASRRVHKQAHYELQIAAGVGLCKGGIAEMQTGEGKTLVALLPAFLFSLTGRGCHIITANDYLAQRDAEFARAVFERLGITVGCLFDGLPRHGRKAEYDCDITYGTAREFGFDFLKDRLAGNDPSTNQSCSNGSATVQRGHFFALVDEADSVMIDDARTPLLIARPGNKDRCKQDLVRICHDVSRNLDARVDFQFQHDERTAALTKFGCLNVLKQVDSRFVHRFGIDDVYRQIENSLMANYLFLANRHYVIENGEIAIVDESTGRIAEGRKWQDGLHQAIEAKESVEITSGTETLAKITVQTYFRKYRNLAGLTGTAKQVADEFKRVYGLGVTTIPTRISSNRKGFSNRIFQRYEDKLVAIATATKKQLAAGQAVLIGSPSVQASRKISRILSDFGVDHHVLNCLEHEHESKIVEQAGIAGRVTVATNMAGRGTDIIVDPSVLESGGLHIIATAKHSSARIDRQLIGRTARQGQSGTYQLFLSLEDELFFVAGEKPKLRFASNHTRELDSKWINVFNKAQSKIENLHEKQRLNLLKHEKNRNQLCLQMGLDPCLEVLEE